MPDHTQSLQTVELPDDSKIKIDTSSPGNVNVVVSQPEFQISKEILNKVTGDDFQYCAVQYASNNPISVYYGKFQRRRLDINDGWYHTGYTLTDEDKLADQLRPFKPDVARVLSKDVINNVIWYFDNPYLPLQLKVKLTLKTDPTKEVYFKVSYNHAPKMIGGDVVKGFEHIEVTDENGDYPPAFEVRLTDENLVGKVGVTVNGLTYSIPKDGLRYSQRDRLYGDMKIVSLDPKKPLLNPIGVAVKACDSHVWGKEKRYWILAQ